MPNGRGGRRTGAGRKKLKAERPEANKRLATEVLELTQRPIHGTKEMPCRCELCKWYTLLHDSGDQRLQFDCLKYLTDRRDGKPVQTVNHVHDKPIEMNVNLSMAEIVRKVRERKEAYERTK